MGFAFIAFDIRHRLQCFEENLLGLFFVRSFCLYLTNVKLLDKTFDKTENILSSA